MKLKYLKSVKQILSQENNNFSFPPLYNYPKTCFSMIKRFTLIISFFTLLSLANAQSLSQNFEIARNTEIFNLILKELSTGYIENIQPGSLTQTAINSMLDQLDPYTNYITDNDIDEYRFMTTGEYGGTGIQTAIRRDTTVIIHLDPSGPAIRSALKPGDKILKIDDISIIGKRDDELNLIFRGQAGTSIKLTILKPGETKETTVELTRANIKVKNVSYSGIVGNNTGYIRLERFTQNASKEVHDALQKMLQKSINGLILDLRGNGGGLLNEAVDICNLFVAPNQLIASTRSRFADKNYQYFTTKQPIALDLPLIILIDRQSASASEIVAGALQDLDRAVIVGEKSFGKGLVQNIVPLAYNTQLKLTVSKYHIPSGRCIQEIDYAHKDEIGLAHQVAPSEIKTFTTKNGRIVSDGRGIFPDLSDISRSGSSLLFHLSNDLCVFDYTNHLISSGNKFKSVKEIQITDKDVENFKQFLGNRFYDYSTLASEIASQFDTLVKNSPSLTETKNIQQELYKLQQQLKEEEYNKYKPILKSMLAVEIAYFLFPEPEVIELSLRDDPDVILACNTITNNELMTSVLDGTCKDCHNKKK